MSELPPVSLEEGEPPLQPKGSPTLRVFGRVLLVAAVVPLGLGLLSQISPQALNLAIGPAVLFVVALPFVCFVASLVLYVRKRRAEALGYLLGGLVGPIIGFGTCFAGFSF